MSKIFFQPTTSQGFFSKTYYAEVHKDEKLLYRVEGKSDRGFKITNTIGKVLCFEKTDRDSKFFPNRIAILHGLDNRPLRLGCQIDLMHQSWGEQKEKMHLHLNITKRAYSNNYFTIEHRDYWSKLQIITGEDTKDLYLAIWWCFNNWFRLGQEQS